MLSANTDHKDSNPFAAGIAFCEGRFVSVSEARVPMLDWGFLRSDAVQDTVSVIDGSFFRLSDHLDRFERNWRRDLDEHEAHTAAWQGAKRRATARRGSLRPLAHSNLHCRPALRRIDRPVAHRGSDGSHNLRSLHRDATRSHPASGRRRHPRQPEGPRFSQSCCRTQSARCLFLFLPAYSPDLNPIEMAFSKLKAHLRAAGAHSYETLWRSVGDICSLFLPRECWNFLKHAGYAFD